MKLKCMLFAMMMLWLSHVAVGQMNYLNESKTAFDTRMKWFREAKYGMFIHFGLYSQLGCEYEGKPVEGYAEWIQAGADIPKERYAYLLQNWNPSKFNADSIAQLAKDAGMKYIVLTTKHHEGFCLWDSPYTDFDIASTALKGRDLVQELATACKKRDLQFGAYYSIIDWHHDSQQRNPEGKDGGARWGQVVMKPEQKAVYIQYMKNQLKELIVKYDTDILWFDGDWVNWWDLQTGQDLYQYLRELKPSLIINNRVAKREKFKRDFGTPEQEHPGGMLNHDWEACYTLNNSWGFKKADENWKTSEEINKKLREINNMGGNLLLNIGPDGNGNIPAASKKILLKATIERKNSKK